MGDISLWDRLWYKYECVGTVEKGLETYKKYRKTPRFRYPGKLMLVLFYIMMVLGILMFIESLRNQANSGKKPRYLNVR